MTHTPYIQAKQAKKKNSNFYTSDGIHVYFKDPLLNDEIDVERVINKIEEIIPLHLRSEIEMVIVGWFEEMEERSINSFYKDGAVYTSNSQQSEEDMYDDILHEIAHSLEHAHGYEIYGDQKVKDEFLRNRKQLHDLLWGTGYKIPENVFIDSEYNEELDTVLYQTLGYDKLSQLVQGLYISAYAPTSLREYFATGFTEFYLEPDHKYLQQLSPALFEKILLLQDSKKLDKHN